MTILGYDKQQKWWIFQKRALSNFMIQQSFMDSSTSGSASSSEAMLASTAVVTDLSSSDPELLPLLVKDRVSIDFPAALAFEL